MVTHHHENRKHSFLSPSSAERWLNCPASANLESNLKDSVSDAADEGTLAHEISHLKLMITSYKGYSGKNSQYAKWKRELEGLKSMPFYSQEMEELTEYFKDYVMAQYCDLKKEDSQAILWLEKEIDLSSFVPYGKGHLDVAVLGRGRMKLIDFKYGKNVEVSAIENFQLRLYSLGVLMDYPWFIGPDEIEMIIYQPRRGHISKNTETYGEVVQWGHSIKEKAADAYAGDKTAEPGPWCKWCKAKAQCSELAKTALSLSAGDPRLSNDIDILSCLPLLDPIVKWAEAVKHFALEKAKKGAIWPGYKLSRKQTRRVFKSDAEKTLYEMLGRDALTLKTITEIEKQIGKKDFASLDLTFKPQGDFALVPEKARGLSKMQEAYKDFE